MKVLFVLAALFAMLIQVYSDPGPAFKKCMADNNSTKEDMKAFADTGAITDGLKCAMKCIMQSKGAMTEDGKLVPDRMSKASDNMEELKDCMALEKGSDGDLCDLAYRHHACVREKIPTFFQRRHKKRSS